MKYDGFKVIDAAGREVVLPADLKDFRGDKIRVNAISRIPDGCSTGRVSTDQGEFYPSVAGLKIVIKSYDQALEG